MTRPATPAPSEQDRARPPRTARLAVIGDVMLGRLVAREIGHRDPAGFWGDTLPALRGADAVLANLECAISNRGAPWTRTAKMFHFRTGPGAIDVLKAAGVRYVSLANNHVLDYGEDALSDTLEHLDAAGIAHAGAGRTLSEARRPARFSVKGLKISAFAVVDHEPAFAAGPDSPGTCLVAPDKDAPAWPDPRTIAAEDADLVVISAHLGPNMVAAPSPRLQALKASWLAAGAHIIHGHSAHVFQGLQTSGQKVILHDTGDFLDDYAVDPEMRNDWSFLFLLDVDATGVRRILLRPVRLGFCEVNLAHGEDFTAICARMARLSETFGTKLRPCPEGLMLNLP